MSDKEDMHRYIFQPILTGILLFTILCMTGCKSTDYVHFDSLYHKQLFAQETSCPHRAASINVGPDLAGNYQAAHGVYLSITTNYGFDFSSGECIPEQGNCGIVTATNGLIYLAPRWNTHPGVPNRLEEVLIPIRWGERRYLVAPARIPEFARSIEKGEEPRKDLMSGDFLLRQGDEKKPATGMPQIPIEAKITKIENVRKVLTASLHTIVDARVTLDAGRAHGVMRKMRFLYPNMEPSPHISIQEVYDNHSVGVLEHRIKPNETWELQEGSKVIHKEWPLGESN